MYRILMKITNQGYLTVTDLIGDFWPKGWFYLGLKFFSLYFRFDAVLVGSGILSKTFFPNEDFPIILRCVLIQQAKNAAIKKN